MKNLIIGIIIGLSIATAASWALDPDWSRKEMERMQQAQERQAQEQFRDEQRKRQLFGNPC